MGPGVRRDDGKQECVCQSPFVGATTGDKLSNLPGPVLA
jgi:hypothetical protein